MELMKRPHFPSDLVKKLNLPFPVVSKNLRYLKERGIVFCYNPNQKRGKLFSITEIGNQIVTLLIEMRE